MTAERSEVVVRDAAAEHVPEILAIYRHYVLHELCTFEEVVPTLEDMVSRRQAVLERGLPYLVGCRGDRVVGYAYAAPYRARAAYARTVENSVYVDAANHGSGVGSALMRAIVDRCARAGLAQIVAVIGDSANAGSIRLHERLGFEHAGTLKGVGYKFGRWVDTVMMQKALPASQSTLPPQRARI